jgi:hypothetical protein
MATRSWPSSRSRTRPGIGAGRNPLLTKPATEDPWLQTARSGGGHGPMCSASSTTIKAGTDRCTGTPHTDIAGLPRLRGRHRPAEDRRVRRSANNSDRCRRGRITSGERPPAGQVPAGEHAVLEVGRSRSSMTGLGREFVQSLPTARRNPCAFVACWRGWSLSRATLER